MKVVVVAMAIPTFVFGGSLFFLIRDIASHPDRLSLLEMVMKTVPYVAVVYPILISCLLFVAFSVTDRIVGPVDRLVRELDERLHATASGPLRIREDDALVPLVDKINQLLARVENEGSRPSAVSGSENRIRTQSAAGYVFAEPTA